MIVLVQGGDRKTKLPSITAMGRNSGGRPFSSCIVAHFIFHLVSWAHSMPQKAAERPRAIQLYRTAGSESKWYFLWSREPIRCYKKWLSDQEPSSHTKPRAGNSRDTSLPERPNPNPSTTWLICSPQTDSITMIGLTRRVMIYPRTNLVHKHQQWSVKPLLISN